MWTEPSPAQELAEQLQKVIDKSRPMSKAYWEDIEKFKKQGWDESEEIYNKKKKLFKKLKNSNLSPSEYHKVMNEINNVKISLLQRNL